MKVVLKQLSNTKNQINNWGVAFRNIGRFRHGSCIFVFYFIQIKISFKNKWLFCLNSKFRLVVVCKSQTG